MSQYRSRSLPPRAPPFLQDEWINCRYCGVLLRRTNILHHKTVCRLWPTRTPTLRQPLMSIDSRSPENYEPGTRSESQSIAPPRYRPRRNVRKDPPPVAPRPAANTPTEPKHYLQLGSESIELPVSTEGGASWLTSYLSPATGPSTLSGLPDRRMDYSLVKMDHVDNTYTVTSASPFFLLTVNPNSYYTLMLVHNANCNSTEMPSADASNPPIPLRIGMDLPDTTLAARILGLSLTVHVDQQFNSSPANVKAFRFTPKMYFYPSSTDSAPCMLAGFRTIANRAGFDRYFKNNDQNYEGSAKDGFYGVCYNQSEDWNYITPGSMCCEPSIYNTYALRPIGYFSVPPALSSAQNFSQLATYCAIPTRSGSASVTPNWCTGWACEQDRLGLQFPFDGVSCLISGLSAGDTVRVKLVYIVELIDYSGEAYQTPSAKLDSRAIEAANRLSTVLPGLYPASFNDWHSFWTTFKGILAKVSAVLSFIPGPIGAVSGFVNKIVS